MRRIPKLKRPLAALALVALVGATAAVAAGVLTIYTNGFGSRAALKQMKQVKGNHCTRRLAQGRMEVTVGKHTPQCVYRAPVTGSKISVTAAVALTKVTPTAKRGRAFQAVWLHGGNGGKYELAVRSQQQKWFLRRYHPPENTVDKKFSGRITTGVHKINGVGKRNRLKLTIFTAGKIVARVNGKVVKRYTDPSPADIGGEDVLLAIGSDGSGVDAARGVVGVFDNVVVQIPDPLSP